MSSPDESTETTASRQLVRGQVTEEVTNVGQPPLQATPRIKEEPGEWDVCPGADARYSEEESEEEVYFDYSTVKAEREEDYPWTRSELEPRRDPLALPGEGIKQEVKEEVPTVGTCSTVARGGGPLGQHPVLLPGKPDLKKEPTSVKALETLAVEVAAVTESAAAAGMETGRKKRNTSQNVCGEVSGRRKLRKCTLTRHADAAVAGERNEDESAGGGEREGSVSGTGTKDGPAGRIEVERSETVTGSPAVHKRKPAAAARAGTERKKRKPNECGEVMVMRNRLKRVPAQHGRAGVACKKNKARSAVGGELERINNGTGNKNVPARRIVVRLGQKVTGSPTVNKRTVPTAVASTESLRKKRKSAGNMDVPARGIMVGQGQSVTRSPPALKQLVPAAVARSEPSSKKRMSAPNLCGEVVLTRNLRKRLSITCTRTTVASEKNTARSDVVGDPEENVGGTGNKGGPARRILFGQGPKVTRCPTKVTGSTTSQKRSVTGSTAAHKQTVTSVACSECAEVFDTEARMKRHALLHTGKKLYDCAECDYRTVRREGIWRHVTVHFVEKPYSCSQCDYRCACRRGLVRHVRCHAREKTYGCTKCDYHSAHRSGLARHMVVHTGEKPFSCSECDYRSAHSRNLTSHMRVHLGDQPYACSECDYRSAHSSDLAKHMRVHTGEKQFACSECDYRSAQSTHLASHLKVHTGDKLYACSECDYRSTVSSHLAKHKRFHTGDKPYACSECDYRSAENSALARHKRIHTGDKPFACSECDYRSANSGNLARHKRIHTGDKPYACSECDYRSAYRNNLARHLK